MVPPWLSWTALAVFSWGFWAVLSAMLGDSISGAHSQALSTLGMLPVLLVLSVQAWGEAKRSPPMDGARRTRGRFWAFLGGIVSCLGNVAFYGVLSSGDEKATTFVPLTALYPVVTILLAMVLLRERLNVLQWLGVGLAVVAIYLLNVKDDRAGWSDWPVEFLIPIGLWGLTGLLQKIATNDVSGEDSTVWFLIAFVLVAPALLWLQPLTGTIAPRTWWLTLVLGFTLALGNYAILAAFKHHGKAAVIAPLSGLYPLVSIPLAAWWFEEAIAGRQGVGILLSLVAVACLSVESGSTPLLKSSKESA